MEEDTAVETRGDWDGSKRDVADIQDGGDNKRDVGG